MLTTDSAIREQILDNWQYLRDTTHPEDELGEYADSEVAVYTSEIIQEWTELPTDYRDGWREIFDTMNSISSAMTTDLYLYYRERYTAIYEEVCQDKERNGE